MSCKVLAAGGDTPVQPMAWPSVHPLPEGTHTPAPPNPGPGSQGQIQELERTWQARVQQALQEGHAKGEAAGVKAAAARLDPVIRRFTETVDELAGLRRRYRADAEEDAVKLAVAVARRILHRELSVDPEAIRGLIRAAFDKIDSREIHRLRVHPEDAAAAGRHFEQMENLRKIEILPDASLERGSCVFDTARGSLDASFPAQLQEIDRGLTDLVRRGGPA